MNDKSQKTMKNLSSALKMQATCSSGMSVYSQKTTWHNNQENCSLKLKIPVVVAILWLEFEPSISLLQLLEGDEFILIMSMLYMEICT
jgi:hypothetical protein